MPKACEQSEYLCLVKSDGLDQAKRKFMGRYSVSWFRARNVRYTESWSVILPFLHNTQSSEAILLLIKFAILDHFLVLKIFHRSGWREPYPVRTADFWCGRPDRISLSILVV